MESLKGCVLNYGYRTTSNLIHVSGLDDKAIESKVSELVRSGI